MSVLRRVHPPVARTRPSAPPRRAFRAAAGIAQRGIIEREAELATFLAAVQAGTLLFLHGPGGVGKTTLLDAFERAFEARGGRTVRLSGRLIEPSPAGFLASLAEALELDASDDVLAALKPAPAAVPGQETSFPTAPGRTLLLLDAFEWLAPLEPWLYDELLTALPAGSSVVIAGRFPPTSAWRTSPAWHGRLRALALRNMNEHEARALLAARDVPEERWDDALAITHGHPLALALLADHLQKNAPWPDALADAPDVVKVLLERFLDDLPSPLHRRALEICAFARSCNEGLLEAMLVDEPIASDAAPAARVRDAAGQGADAAAAFSWLYDLSFIEHDAFGVFPHDLARDTILANLRWRHPDAYRALYGRLWRHLERRELALTGAEQARATADAIYLCRHSPVLRDHFAWGALDRPYPKPSTPADRADIIAVIRALEGEAFAEVAAYWQVRQPQAFVASRGTDGVIDGFWITLTLAEPTDADLAADPALRALWSFLPRAAPLRAGEVVLYHRFFTGQHAARADSQSVTRFAHHASRAWLSTPNLAWSVLAHAHPERVGPIMGLIRHGHASEADFRLGGVDHAVFAHDWRAESYRAWSNAVAALALDAEAGQAAAPVQPLSRAEFEQGVRQALRDFTHLRELGQSPLLRARMVLARSGGRPTAAALQALLRDAADTLKTSGAGLELYRVIERTYIEPTATKELAANALKLSYSTYRRRLIAATERIIDDLWEREQNSAGA